MKNNTSKHSNNEKEEEPTTNNDIETGSSSNEDPNDPFVQTNSSSSSLPEQGLERLVKDPWIRNRLLRSLICSLCSTALFCTPAIRDFLGPLAFVLSFTSIVFTTQGSQLFGMVLDRALKFHLVLCVVCAFAILAVYTSGGNSFALVVWLCAVCYPLGVLATHDVSWFGATFLGGLFYYVILFKSYAEAQYAAQLLNDTTTTTTVLEDAMKDATFVACQSILTTAVLGTLVVLLVNALVLPEYGRRSLEKTIEEGILPQIKGILRLSIETQLFERQRASPSFFKHQDYKRRLYSARAKLQQTTLSLPLMATAARMELRFYDPSKGKQLRFWLEGTLNLSRRVLALSHVLCAEENEATKELWKDAFSEYDNDQDDDASQKESTDVSFWDSNRQNNDQRFQLVDCLNGYLETALRDLEQGLQDQLSNPSTKEEGLVDLASRLENQLSKAAHHIASQEEPKDGRRPSMLCWLVRSEGKRTMAFVHGMISLLGPLEDYRKASLDYSNCPSEGAFASLVEEWKALFPFAKSPARNVDWIHEVCHGSPEKNGCSPQSHLNAHTYCLRKALRFIHSDPNKTSFKFVLALAVGGGAMSFFPNSFSYVDHYQGLAMVAGILALGMRAEVGWYLSLTYLKLVGLFAAIAWSLLWYGLCFLLPQSLPSTSSVYPNLGLGVLQITLQFFFFAFNALYPSKVYAGFMAMILFIVITNAPMSLETDQSYLVDFHSFGRAVGYRLCATIMGSIIMAFIGVFINPIYAYQTVSVMMADMIHDIGLSLPRSVILTTTTKFPSLELQDRSQYKALLAEDIAQLQTAFQLTSNKLLMLLPPSSMEVQLEDNARYDPKIVKLLHSHILSAVTNVQHMVVMSPDYTEIRDGQAIAHEVWLLNRMIALRLQAAESSLRSFRPIHPAYPSATFDEPRRRASVLALRRQLVRILKDHPHPVTKQGARTFYFILLFHDVSRIEALISCLYGNRSKDYLVSLESNTKETKDDRIASRMTELLP